MSDPVLKMLWLYPEHMKGALVAVREVLDEMRVSNGGPALAAE